MAFYQALRIYPNPVDLLGIYQKTIPEPVFKVCPRSTIFRPYLMSYTLAYCGND